MKKMRVESELDKPLTILIPTFNRAAKLRRFLSYLINIEPDKKAVISNVDFLIADGSAEQDYKNDKLIEQLKKKGVGIKYCHLPRVGLQDRFIIISKKIKTNYVLCCGDEDLVDFGAVANWLKIRNKLPGDSVYAGRLVNILGLSIFGLKTSCLERPYYGFKVAAEDVKVRLLMNGLANAFGISSLSYAIQPTVLFSQFWSMTEGRVLYHGGIEFAHQTFLAAKSKIYFSEETLIYRDFAYIDYKYDELREAPTTDKYPYLGEEAVNLAVRIVSQNCPADSASASEIIESIIDVQTSVLPSRLRFQNMFENYGSKICSEGDMVTVTAIKSVWLRTYFSSYPGRFAIKKLVILSLPAGILSFIRKLFKK